MIKMIQFTTAMQNAKIMLTAQEKAALTSYYNDYQNNETKDVLLEKLMKSIGLPAQTYGSNMRPQARVRMLSAGELEKC